MGVLTNNTADALQELKAAIAVHVENAENSGKTWTRIRYADNLGQWLELAAIEKVGGEEVLRVCFIYLAGFTSIRSEARQRRITATFSIEIIQQFQEGTDEDNSTLTFERLLGDLDEAFSSDTALGFTDAASQDVENGSFQANLGENEGKPQYVDGVLSHRIIGSLEVYFRLC